MFVYMCVIVFVFYCLLFVCMYMVIICLYLYLHRYYKVNDVRRFKFDRPFHKGTKDPQNEFAVSSLTNRNVKYNMLLQTLWFERTTMTTSSSFPGVIDWFEVTESKTVSTTLMILYDVCVYVYTCP